MSLSLLLAAGLALALVYYLVPARLRWALLLVVSLAVYGVSGIRGIPFILLTAFSTFAFALLIERVGDQGKADLAAKKGTLDAAGKKALRAKTRAGQRALMLLCLALNFGILAVLKYADPLAEALRGRGLGLVLPLGISFYTFQSMGYLLDVYNGKLHAERRPLRFLLFISFFPQLIQGPIARYDQLAPQLETPHAFDLEAFERGLLLMLWGFFKKKVIADRAFPFVAEVFDNQSAYGGAMIVVAVLLYSLQQYCDFSGGIDLVTGMAELYGIRLAPNFRRPYFAVSLADFWRRWHISLGAWMRDYVFYPFALSRPMAALSKALRGRHPQLARALPAAIGNVLVFFLVGLWHGAQMNYILWGLYNGVLLAIAALMEPAVKQWNQKHTALSSSRGFTVFRILRTFLVVNIGWFFDRSMRAMDALRMFAKTLTRPGWEQLSDGTLNALGIHSYDWPILAAATALLFVVSLLGERGKDVRALVFSRPLALRWALLFAFMLFTLATFIGEGKVSSGFMYAVF